MRYNGHLANKTLCKIADDSLLGAYPGIVVDHRQSLNPYLSRFGEDHWEAEIAKAIKGHICVTELIIHMMTETERVMKGTKHEKTWRIFHDALSQVKIIATLSEPLDD